MILSLTQNPLLNGRWFDELDKHRLIEIFVWKDWGKLLKFNSE